MYLNDFNPPDNPLESFNLSFCSKERITRHFGQGFVAARTLRVIKHQQEAVSFYRSLLQGTLRSVGKYHVCMQLAYSQR